jgi:hypothetical protein
MYQTTAIATGIPDQKPIISRANPDYCLWKEEREETWTKTGKGIIRCGQYSLLPALQFVEECPGFLKVSGVKAFGEPAVDLGQ